MRQEGYCYAKEITDEIGAGGDSTRYLAARRGVWVCSDLYQDAGVCADAGAGCH